MRTVVRSSEIAHLWAHQTQSNARSGNMSFHGVEFSSYSTVIASIATNRKGQKAYLVGEDRYSRTTSKHLYSVRRAIPNDAVEFLIPGTVRGGYNFADNARIMRDWSNNVKRLLDEAGASRQPKKNRLILEASQTVDRMRAFAAFFDLRKVSFPALPNNPDELAQMLADKAAREAKTLAAAVARRKREEAKAKRESIAKRDAWLAGEKVDGYYGNQYWSQYHETLLRIVGDDVETSRGASFPVRHAKRGLMLVRAVIARGIEWQRNGETCRLGHYQIDRIEPNGTVHAGCHVVPYSAIERIAPQLLATKDGE